MSAEIVRLRPSSPTEDLLRRRCGELEAENEGLAAEVRLLRGVAQDLAKKLAVAEAALEEAERDARPVRAWREAGVKVMRAWGLVP